MPQITESQHRKYREEVAGNLRKAIEAAEARAYAAGEDEISPGDRMRLALAAAQIGTQVMIAERLGQIVNVLLDDHVEQELKDRLATGESLVERLLKTLEDADIPPEAEVTTGLAEDWLTPEGAVSFVPEDPES